MTFVDISRPVRLDQRPGAAVLAVGTAEVVGLVVAAGRLEGGGALVAPPTSTHVAGLLLVGAALLLASGLLLQVVGHGRDSTPGLLVLGFAGYLSVGPLASLLVGQAAGVAVGRGGQGVLLLVLGVALLGPVTPGRRELLLLGPVAAGVALVAVAAWREPMTAAAHLASGAMLVAGWSVVAVGLCRRVAPGTRPPVALAFVVVMGSLPVLRGLDGVTPGPVTLLAAGGVLSLAAAHLGTSWLAARRSALAAAEARAALRAEEAARSGPEQRLRVHDARNTCAVVRMAVDLLCDDEGVDRDTALRLRQAAVGSLDQLEDLVASGTLGRTA